MGPFLCFGRAGGFSRPVLQLSLDVILLCSLTRDFLDTDDRWGVSSCHIEIAHDFACVQ